MMLDTIVTAPLERKIATLESCVVDLEAKLEYMKVLAAADGQRIAELEQEVSGLRSKCNDFDGDGFREYD